tara:strand:- start:142 stop:294 length:153 start_codon:yes stop_codon:yes gene_type:complete
MPAVPTFEFDMEMPDMKQFPVPQFPGWEQMPQRPDFPAPPTFEDLFHPRH